MLTRFDALAATAAKTTSAASWVAFLGALAVGLRGLDPSINWYDQGIILVGVERVLEGEVAYRDFWTMYGPGQFYAVAGLFSLLGTEAWMLRLYGVLVKAGIVDQYLQTEFVQVERFGSMRVLAPREKRLSSCP